MHQEILISYADTDAAGIIYYAAWFPWMERLHTEWLLGYGIRFPELYARCGASVVTRATSCEYLAVVRPYDRVDIAMSLGRVGPRSYQLEYTMTRIHDETHVARATLTLVGIDLEGRSTALPEPITELFVSSGPVVDPAKEYQ